ncbi:MAG: type II toxin-antitoxin system Phd/YefM family antitoxin [Clostridia bacterium]|nr:type II toxin-antitoxin system Phd/YefM family antitoxin [Clostridia bacterium]
MESNIRPSSDLRNHYAEVSRQCKEQRRPIHITVNGRGDTVLLSETDFQEMQSELELLRSLALSQADIENGRVQPLGSLFDDLRERLKVSAAV